METALCIVGVLLAMGLGLFMILRCARTNDTKIMKRNKR